MTRHQSLLLSLGTFRCLLCAFVVQLRGEQHERGDTGYAGNRALEESTAHASNDAARRVQGGDGGQGYDQAASRADEGNVSGGQAAYSEMQPVAAAIAPAAADIAVVAESVAETRSQAAKEEGAEAGGS
ncbi:unnamed protein product [Amoebophrya sp. A25]|nr:unnamed protein product [Amoebophrya sp. A25]|eukprot:GSA25T00007785001.1